MNYERPCEYCPFSCPDDLGCCPHCGRPAHFPNVSRASKEDERAALSDRYTEVKRSAVGRGAGDVLETFESALEASKAVIARSFIQTQAMASGPKSVLSTYYRELQSGVRLADDHPWNRLRPMADEKLFGVYKDEVRFAALSLDGKGLDHYGDCSWVLRDDMVAHRASTFEANAAVFVKKLTEQQVRAGGSVEDDVPPGYRAAWEDRAKHGVAKLGDRIEPTTAEDEYVPLLLNPAPDPADDDFIEVHVGGPLTVRTLEKVVVHKRKGPSSKSLFKELESELSVFDVRFERRK